MQASYYEVYCEKVCDLLYPSHDNIEVRGSTKEGFIIPEMTEMVCERREDILQVITQGKANRKTSATLMNAESSRSHSILSILVAQSDEETGRKKKSRLFLVDLAGNS